MEEMEELARRQITDDIEAMDQVLGITAGEAEEAAASIGQEDAELILAHLKQGTRNAFPEPPETALEVKYVPEEMEEHLSPAFYMIPAIDNTHENVIYINQAHMGNDLTLFTTLAHEMCIRDSVKDEDVVQPLKSVIRLATDQEMCIRDRFESFSIQL